MENGAEVKPAALPIVVSFNGDRGSAIARLVLGALVVLGIAGTVALPVYDLVVRSHPPRPRDEYEVPAAIGGAVAFLAGIFWMAALPATWTIDGGGITREGPGDRRRDLRWADVRRILPTRQGYEFYSRTGLRPIVLPWEAVPKDRRAAVYAAVEAVLRAHFDFPPERPFTWKSVAGPVIARAVLMSPPLVYVILLNRLVKTSLDSILTWTWVRHLIAWNRTAAPALVPLILFAPVFLWLLAVSLLIGRSVTRRTQIVPRQPGPR